MIVFPNAKINLGLCITEKRADGFHNLSSVFYPVHACCDILEAIQVSGAPGKCTIETPGIDIVQKPEDNLVVKAYKLLSEISPLPATHFVLKKLIPTGAGLGGGSSDAAFTLKMLVSMFGLSVSADDIYRLAEKLGSDVPFFIDNVPANVSGRGEVLMPSVINLKGYYLMLVHPGIFVSTADAYRMVRPAKPKSLPQEVVSSPVASWKHSLVNDFEEPMFAAYPRIGELKKKMYDHGALFALMSGSGSSVYGIFEKEPYLFDFPGAAYMRVFSL